MAQSRFSDVTLSRHEATPSCERASAISNLPASKQASEAPPPSKTTFYSSEGTMTTWHFSESRHFRVRGDTKPSKNKLHGPHEATRPADSSSAYHPDFADYHFANLTPRRDVDCQMRSDLTAPERLGCANGTQRNSTPAWTLETRTALAASTQASIRRGTSRHFETRRRGRSLLWQRRVETIDAVRSRSDHGLLQLALHTCPLALTHAFRGDR